jgi:hypothetical protein
MDKRVTIGGGAVAAILLILGLYFTFFSTDVLAKHAIEVATTDLERGNTELVNAGTNGVTKSKSYNAKYGIQISSQLLVAASDLDSAKALLAQAQAASKSDEKKRLAEQSSDASKKAEADIKTAQAMIDSLDKAYKEAPAAVAAADSAVTQGSASIEQIISQTGFERALSGDRAKIISAKATLDLAHKAMETQGGIIDAPVAYENAVNAKKVADDATLEAKTLVSLARDNSAKIAALKTDQAGSASVLLIAGGAFGTLHAYHDASSWSQVSNFGVSIPQYYANAASFVADAEKANANDVQDFTKARDLIAQASQATASAKNQLATLVALKAELERDRINWPSEFQAASDAINAERSKISSYGSYSSSATSNFNAAVNDLNRATGYASRNDYADAVKYANDAESEVSGAGNRAYNAYQAYLADQAAKRRAAEARAVQQAADAVAARQAAERVKTKSFSSDSGSSGGRSSVTKTKPFSGGGDGGGFSRKKSGGDGGSFGKRKSGGDGGAF